MDQDCIFCKIVNGDIPAANILETETMFAFLDIAPVNKGHALVVPKAHLPTIFDIPAELGSDLLSAVRSVGRALMETTGATGLNIMMNNYRDAGQLVDHSHWHLVPRFPEDGLSLWEQKSYDDAEEMNSLAQDIASRVD